MKATRIFVANQEEHINAEKYGLKQRPPIETEGAPFYFRLDGVTMAFITLDNFINITLFGQQVFLKNESSVWSKIKNYLE